MRISLVVLAAGLTAAPAFAQAHARHTAAHDSAHAIVLDDAQHLALHQLLLGRWVGIASHGNGHGDTLNLRFENDSDHQQLMIRDRQSLVGFEIRGDTLSWKQSLSGAGCVASTPVSALLQATKAPPSQPVQVSGTVTCGKNQTPLTLRKVGS